MRPNSTANSLFLQQQLVILSVLWASALFETGLPGIPGFPGLTVFMLSAFALLGTVAVDFFVKRNLEMEPGSKTGIKSLFVLLVLSYIALTLLGAAYSSNMEIGLFKTFRIAWFSILAVVSADILRKLEREKALYFLCISGFIVLLVLGALTFSATNLARNWSQHSLSVFQDYNTYFLHFIVAGLLSIVLLRKTFPRQLWLAFGGFTGFYALLSYMLLFSGSRRGILFYVIPLAVMFAVVLFRYKRVRIPLVCMVVLLILSFQLLLPQLHEEYRFTTVQRIIITTSEQGTMGLILPRFNRIDKAVEIINDFSLPQFFWGAGTGSLRIFYSPGDHPHNFFFNSFLEGGLIKAIVLLLLLLCFLTLAIRATAMAEDIFEKVFILSSALMFLATVSISGEDSLVFKLFWFLSLYYWVQTDEKANQVETA